MGGAGGEEGPVKSPLYWGFVERSILVWNQGWGLTWDGWGQPSPELPAEGLCPVSRACLGPHPTLGWPLLPPGLRGFTPAWQLHPLQQESSPVQSSKPRATLKI